jgi:hypothetical protein
MTPDSTDFQEGRDSILIVKGRFKAGSLKLFGQFVLIFRNSTAFDVFNAVVSTYSDLYNLEPHEDWMKYKEFIANAKWKGTFNSNLSNSLVDEFKKFSEQMNSITLLYNNVSEYDYNAMEIMLYDLIYRIVHDKDLILETGIQEITPSEYKESSKAPETASKPAEKEDEHAGTGYTDYSLEKDAVILPVKPIVAPIKGKPIYELRVGDKLMIYIQPLSDRANYYIDYLGLREDKEIVPTMAQVIDIKAGSGKNNPTDILTLISPGVYGKFTEIEKQVKLRIYDPLTDGQIKIKETEKSKKKNASGSAKGDRKAGFSKGTMVMLALFMIILMLFIVLIFLSW